MNKKLLHSDVQNFIDANLKADITKLILKGSPFEGITSQALAGQIVSKVKCLNKLPTWIQTKNIYYPDGVNIEQTSSEITAGYKSKLVSGNTLIDLTGGFGVDSYFFAQQMKQVIHCEIDQELASIVSYNFEQLAANNIECLEGDGISLLKSSTLNYDWIYLDPSRRSQTNAKVFRLEDCLPDVTQHLQTLLDHSNRIMIKLSPFLDISSTISSLQFVKEIHVVAVKNEVKELIVLIEKGYTGTCILTTIDLRNETEVYFNGSFPSLASASYALPQKFLYEPNSAILKSGLFNEVSSQLSVHKLHNNSHLYTSDVLVNFPGRVFEIVSVIQFNRKQVKKLFGGKKANIATRNFHDSVADIRKKTGIKDGGDDYLFFTTDLDERSIVIHGRKV